MRLPVSKIYRAFPELDRFSDEQCDRFVERARLARSFENMSSVVMFSVVAAIGLCCAAQTTLSGAMFKLLRNALGSVRDAQDLQFALSLLMWIAVPAFAGLLARDVFLRRRLHDVIWRRLEQVRCPHCRYSLLGQRVNDGLIRCPECGGTTTLETLGLASEEDLIPPRSENDELAREPDA
ncbi:MAG TPA: hypothetical protein VMS30_09425 [Phycisphaerales bacterium]|nr:hypothetical protein [Phycisphaerales bacterium]